MGQKKSEINILPLPSATTLPKISVIMSVFNGEVCIGDAIDSILTQSFREFEFIIIDDGSMDRSLEIINSYKDDRIKLITNNTNIGLPGSLNRAIDKAKGKYIVRFDVDDISLENRLYEQYNYMEINKEIGICGSWTKLITKGEDGPIHRYSTSSDMLNCQLLFFNPICHPSVIIRKEILEKHELRYDESFRLSQDYDLWSRAAKLTKLGNIDKVLLLYRQHNGEINPVRSAKQIEYSHKVRSSQLDSIGVSLSNVEQEIYIDVYLECINLDKYEINDVVNVFLKIKEYAQESGLYENTCLEKVIGQLFYSFIINKPVNASGVYIKILCSPVGKIMSGDLKMKILIRYFIAVFRKLIHSSIV